MKQDDDCGAAETPQETIAARTVHTFSNDALGDHDAVGIAEQVRAGEVSTQEVAAAAINRARHVNPQLNGIALETFSQALTQAEVTPAGDFAGVPTFVKDNTDLLGVPTNQGSLAVNARPAKSNGAFAKQFLAQGFLVLGKSAMPEFGLNASTEFKGRPPTCNPWHLDYSAGASSGGAAALVAAGVVPIAHGNDGGGSIRIPAACCGLIGLKPTRGRLKDDETMRALPIKIISEGVLTRSVRDTAHFFANAERYYYNAKLPAIGLVQGPNKRRLKIGVVYDSITGHRTDDDTRSTVALTARMFTDMGHSVDEMPVPIASRFADDFSVYWGMLTFLLTTFGKRIFGTDFDAKELDNLSLGLTAYYKKNVLKTPFVLRRLMKSSDDYARIFQNYDVVLSPVLAHTTPKLGYLSPEQDFEQLFHRLRKYASFTPLNNAAGGPAISLPMGNTANGLPVAVHCSANHGAEQTLLELAFEIEQARPWRRIQDSAK